jgi:predicted nucleotidyltransferase
MDRGNLPDVAQIQPLLEAIRGRMRPVGVWLFGSRARGNHHEHSDWDLLVVVPDEAPAAMFDPMHLWNLLELCRFSVDLVPYTETGFREDQDTPNTIPYSVAREGVRLA